MVNETHVLSGFLKLLQDLLLPLPLLQPPLGLRPSLRLPLGRQRRLSLGLCLCLSLGQRLGLAPRPRHPLHLPGLLQFLGGLHPPLAAGLLGFGGGSGLGGLLVGGLLGLGLVGLPRLGWFLLLVLGLVLSLFGFFQLGRMAKGLLN